MVVFIHVVQHLQQYYDGIEWMSDWGNIGLVMFFVMSAFLYADRKIEHRRMWFLHRYVELAIPAVFTVVMTLIIYQVIYGSVGVERWISSLLCGLGFEAFVTDGWLWVQYWFITYILVCYLTIPFIQKINLKKLTEAKFWVAFIVGCIFMQGVLSIVGYISNIPTLSWGVLLRFYMPYAMYRRYDSKSIIKPMKMLTILSAICVTITCVVRYYYAFEGVLGALSELLFIYTQTLTGTVIFYWLYQAFSKVKKAEKVIAITDRYSYPVYLTHCLFVGYHISMIDKFQNHFVGVIVALLCTVIVSIFVEKLTTPMRKWANHGLITAKIH
jgi:fucose 4-O-acetylase-like acetyltransferase